MMLIGITWVEIVQPGCQWLATTLLAEAEPAQKLPGFLDEFLKNTPWGTVVGGFVALAVVLGWLAQQTETLQKLIEGWQKISASFRKSSSEQTADSRKKLLKILKGEVARRRKGSLHNLVMMDLRFQEQPQQVGQFQLPELAPEPQIERTLQVSNQPDIPLESNRRIIDVFNQPEIQGKLLILGEPGAGKTTELLRLANDLISQAEVNETTPIPIIFELSSWKDDRQSIDQWLIAQLKENYNVPKAISEQWLKQEQLLPLLDGLDELGLARQIQCVKAINQFLKESRYSHVIVCCRREEYEEGQVKLNELNGSVYLQPLADAQIQKYLEDVKRPNLWQTIEHEPDLKELAKSPLLLTMMVVAYQGRAIHNRQELFDAYIGQQFDRPIKQQKSNIRIPPRKRTLEYLNWLAKKLKEESTNEFFIEKLQPSWLKNKRTRKLYQIVGAVALSLILCGIFYLLLDFILNFVVQPPQLFTLHLDNMQVGGFNLVRVRQKLIDGYGAASSRGLYSTLFFILIIGFAVGFRLNRRSIEFTESLQIFRASKQKLKGWIIFGSMVGLFFATIVPGVYLIVAHLYSPRLFVLHLDDFEVNGQVSTRVRQQLVNAFGEQFFKITIFLVVFWFLFWIFFGLSRGLLVQIQSRKFPNQGVIVSAKNALIFSVFSFTALIIVALLTGLPTENFNTLTYTTVLSILIGLLSGVAWGGFACIQHFVLRVFLWHSGSVPWNYAQFLNYASDLRFLQRVGGRYRFLHDLLREHFAHMDNKG